MKSLVLALCLMVGGGGEQEEGLRLYGEGRYTEAVDAFRRAEAQDGPSAELSYNLALALWKAGRGDEAETEAERAATLSDGDLSPLRDGVLGNLRFEAAKAKETEDLASALQAAEQARDHYLRASRSGSSPEIARNLERALRLIEELRKKQEEQEKKDDEKKDDENKDESEDKKDDEKKEQEEKKEKEKKDQDEKDEQKESDEQKSDEQNENEKGGKGEQDQPPEPDPHGEPKEDESKKDESSQPQPQQPQPDESEPSEESSEPPPTESDKSESKKTPPVPGELDPSKELTPEQRRQLMQQLENLDAQMRKLRARQKARRPKVEKDW